MKLSQSRPRPQSQSLRIPLPPHYKEAWALIHDRRLFLGCCLGGRGGRSGAAAHLINADLAGHTVASNSGLPVALIKKRKKQRKKEKKWLSHNFTLRALKNSLCNGPLRPQLIKQLAGEFCGVLSGLKSPFALLLLTAASVFDTWTETVICHF